MWLAYLSDSERRDSPDVFLASADDLKHTQNAQPKLPTYRKVREL